MVLPYPMTEQRDVIVTFAVSLIVSEIQAVLMLKTTFCLYPLVFDLESEDHGVGMWK